MLNRLFVASVAVLALALVPQAGAKGIEKATVCGVDECVDADRDDLGPALLGGGYSSGPPAQAEPWYRARLRMGDGRPGGRIFETFTINVLPETGYIRSPDEYGGSMWTTMSNAQRTIYRRLTGGLAPLPAAELKGIPAPQPSPADEPIPRDPAPADPAPADDGAGAWTWLVAAFALTTLIGAAAFVRRGRRRSAATT
jgi:hypothetical protein